MSAKIKAFTLLECLVSLLVISGAVLVYQGLTKSVVSEIRYLSRSSQRDWSLFVQQLSKEFEGASLVKVDSQKIYLKKGNKDLAFGLSKSDDFRKTHSDGRGYQPMIYGLDEVAISQTGAMIRLDFHFKDDFERTFVYAFEEKG